jgi:hypothetical protein
MIEQRKQDAKELRMSQKKIKREVIEAEKEAVQKRKAARSSKAQLKKIKDDLIKEMKSLKRACKAIEKKLDTATRKYQRNSTIALNREIERLKQELAEVSMEFILSKEAADEAVTQ